MYRDDLSLRYPDIKTVALECWPYLLLMMGVQQCDDKAGFINKNFLKIFLPF